jgi:hypothetical protein
MTTLDMYRSMRTDQLKLLRRAFELDRTHSGSKQETCFIDSRLVLINLVLAERLRASLAE